MYKAEGVGSFWKGIAAPLMVETPKRAWKFCTFENFKNALNYRGQDKQPSPLTYSLAGFLAGATEGIIVNPFEAIKVREIIIRKISIFLNQIFHRILGFILIKLLIIGPFIIRLKHNQIHHIPPNRHLLLLLRDKLHLKKVISIPTVNYIIFQILYLLEPLYITFTLEPIIIQMI